MKEFLATAAVFALLRGLLVIGLLSRISNIIFHAGQLTNSTFRRLSRAVLGHGLEIFSSLGSVAISALAIFASIGRNPLAHIMSLHSIEYWLGSNPLTVGALGLAGITLSSLAAPVGAQTNATAGGAGSNIGPDTGGASGFSTGAASGSFATPYLDSFGVVGNPVQTPPVAMLPPRDDPELSIDTFDVIRDGISGANAGAELFNDATNLGKATDQVAAALNDPESPLATKIDVSTAIMGEWLTSSAITGGATIGGTVAFTAIDPLGGEIVGGALGGELGSMASQVATQTMESMYGDATKAGLARARGLQPM
jgi:hypothetical protein